MLNEFAIVKFKENSKTYDYLNDIFLDIKVGDKVIVPVGALNEEKEAEVVGFKDEITFPVEKCKTIKRAVKEEETIIDTEREAWLKGREGGIGGSDAASILGLNPYKTNVELWEEKTGRRKPEDISNKDYVIYGKKAEKYIIELFKLENEKYEVTQNEYKILKNERYPYIIGTVDAELRDKNTGQRGILEIKTCSIKSEIQRNKWIDQLPKNYEVQIYHYLLVTGYDFAILRARLRNERNIIEQEYYISKEDDEIRKNLETLLNKEVEFWEEYVMKDKCPPLELGNI